MNKQKAIMAAGIALAMTATAGCDGAIFRTFDIDAGNSLSIGARQRTVIVTTKGGVEGDRQVVCAEPSPDVFAVRAASASAALQRGPLGVSGATGAAAQQTASAGFGFASSETGAAINRTQTIQLLRDGLFRLCEAYMNGAVDETQYNIALANFDKVMANLLAIDGIAGSPIPPAIGISAGQASATVGPDGQQNAVAGAGAQIQIGGGGQFSPAAIAASITKATSKEGFDQEAFFAELSKFGGTGGVTVINPPGAGGLFDSRDENLAYVAQLHHEPQDRVGTFAAVCIGILSRYANQEFRVAENSSRKALIQGCKTYLANAPKILREAGPIRHIYK